MAKSDISAPSLWFSPVLRKKINWGRLHTSIIGLGIVYTFGSFIPAPFQWIAAIYTSLSWFTILTIDPTRLPDAATTKINQRKAWRYLGLLFPLYAVVIGILLFKSTLYIDSISVAKGISLISNAFMIELYFRNVLQAKLRTLGLSVQTSICLQSMIFAVHYYFISYSLLLSTGAFIVGTINGIIIYKTRSMYPNFVILLLWVFVFGN